MSNRLVSLSIFATVAGMVSILISSAILPLATQAQDQVADGIASELLAPQRIEANGAPIDVAGYAAPFLADLNDDGRKDLLVGQLDKGRLRIYPNVGTDQEPRFADYSWFQADGMVAGVPAGCAVGFTPQVIDYDRDGHLDVLSGSYFGATCFLFRGTWQGRFEAGVPIQNEEGNVQLLPDPERFRYNSTAFAYDWDQDNDLDFVIGRVQTHVLLNHGTDEQPLYGEASRVKLGGEDLPNSMVPVILADWNGDGRDDLIAMDESGIVWYRGVGMHGFPDFDEPKVLVTIEAIANLLGQPRDEGQEIRAHRVYAVCVSDFNGDDRPDLLVGDHYCVSREVEEDEQAKKEAYKRLSGYWKSYRDLVQCDPTSMTRAERSERFRSALQDWNRMMASDFAEIQSSFSRYELHGNVWVFERR